MVLNCKRFRVCLLALTMAGLGSAPARAQGPVSPVSSQALLATREELQDVLSRLPRRSNEAILLRERLEQGDFEPGDRMVVTLRGEGGFTDTVAVRTGRLIDIRSFATISLVGILRSEVGDKVRGELARVLRNPDLTVTPLVRLGVLGGVVRPGFYSLPAEMAIGDALMVAGPLAPEAALEKVKHKRYGRGGFAALDKEALLAGLANGTSIDRLNLMGGDVIEIGRRRPSLDPLQLVLTLVTLATFTITLTQTR